MVTLIECKTNSMSAGDALCIASALKSLESTLGAPLSISALQGPDFAKQVALKGLSKDVLCTACMQAAWSVIKPTVSPTNASPVESQITDLCGAVFLSKCFMNTMHETDNSSYSGNPSFDNRILAVGKHVRRWDRPCR